MADPKVSAGSVRGATKTVLRVAWSPHDHELLRGENITALRAKLTDAERAALPPVPDSFELRVQSRPAAGDAWTGLKPAASNAPNAREFEVPSDHNFVEIVLEFFPVFATRSFDSNDKVSAVDTGTFIRKRVLKLNANLVRGTFGGAKARPQSESSDEDPSRLYHPIEEFRNSTREFMKWPRYQTRGDAAVTELTFRPDVVDATDVWRACSTPHDINVFEKCAAVQQGDGAFPSGDVWDSLRILGFTTTTDGFLVAAFLPKATRKGNAPLGAFVMFTPGYSAHSSIAVAAGGARHSQYVFNRYLLEGRRDSPWVLGRDFFPVINDEDKEYSAVCVGFSSSLERSKKRVVLLIPLSNGGGAAYPMWTRAHGNTLLRVVTLLWHGGSVASSAPDPPSVNRHGLGGFSRGGEPLILAVKTNSSVRLIAAFDAKGPEAVVDGVKRPQKFTEAYPEYAAWIAADKRNIFFLTAGAFVYRASDASAIAKNLSTYSGQVFTHPQQDGFWGPYTWPDPDAPAGAPDAEAPGEVGERWLAALRPSADPKIQPTSLRTQAELRGGLLLVSTASKPAYPQPLPYYRSINIMKGYKNRLIADTVDVQNLGHQFAISGGGKIPTPKGGEVDMTYLQCMFEHWGRYT